MSEQLNMDIRVFGTTLWPNLAKAIVMAYGEMKGVKKNKKGYGYKYTSLDLLNEESQPILAKNNLALSNIGQVVNGQQMFYTLLIHESGESLASELAIEKAGLAKANDAQQTGAAITYARRYLNAAILNIASDEDDDAESLT